MQYALASIKYSSDTARKFSVTPEEEAFFEAFDAALRAARKSSGYRLTRMADGTIEVSSSRAYVGKIKLQGRKTRMQYMKSLYNADAIEDATLEEYITGLKHWVKTA